MCDAVNLLRAASEALLKSFFHTGLFTLITKKEMAVDFYEFTARFLENKNATNGIKDANNSTGQSCVLPQPALQTPDKAAMSTPPLDLRSRFEAEGRAAAYRQLPLLSQPDPLFIFSQGLPLHQISYKPLLLVTGLALPVWNKMSYN